MTEHVRERNARGSGGQLRNELIAAGVALLDDTGDPTCLTLRAVARQAGVAAPSIYRHFDELASLVAAVLEASFDELEQAVRSALATGTSSGQALLNGCGAYVRFGWEHRARYLLMFAAEGFAPNAVGTFALVRAAIEQAVRDGESGSDDPHLDTFLVWTALHGIATLQKPTRADYRRLGPLDRPAAVHTLVRRIAKLEPADS